MKPSQALQAHRVELRKLTSRHGVSCPRVFGSVLYGEDRDGSDLDLLVDPTPSTTLLTLAAIQLEAERLLGVPVDVHTPNALPRRGRERILREAVAV
ncbi:MAG TPA: nucleotidyltransferase family protein [Xanthomonadaceae bacterium]|jgi:predicted nucleotidyltransferase|nr:nucleotidyltransferase family protein [Xanthomonadaceae bacterium]